MEEKNKEAIRLAKKVKWLTKEEKEMYAGAIYSALCWCEYISKRR